MDDHTLQVACRVPTEVRGRRPELFPRALWWTVALVALGFSGCSALRSQPALDNLTQSKPAASAPGPQGPPSSCVVLFKSRSGKKDRVEVPMDGPTQIQQLLEDIDGVRYRRTIVTILRDQPGAPTPVVMEVNVDRRTRRIREEFNYAVFPGDRILVQEDERTMFDDLTQKYLGPLAQMGQN